jgi:hypothetical protein
MDFELKSLTRPAKVLVVAVILSLLSGYIIAILQGLEHTSFNTDKVVKEYRGSDNTDELAFPKPYREILQNTHAHALSIPLVYFLLSLLFLGTQVSQKAKSILIALLFLGFFLEYLSLWSLRYIHTGFVNLSVVSHVISAPVYIFMCVRSLWDTCVRR